MATDRMSSYLTHLPAIFQQDAFLGRFLLAFERVLSGLHPPDPDDPLPEQPGLEDVLDRIYIHFDPGPGTAQSDRTPEAFLPWLASWVALSLREDWAEEEKRRFLSRIVPLYRQRGTKGGLQDVLTTYIKQDSLTPYTREDVKIYEFDQPVHYFQVEMTLPEPDPTALRRREKIARAIIDQEKPAHTFYTLQILIPTMQIINDDPINGILVGQNTLLGTTSYSASGEE
ncbi:MAG: phage tail protein I [Anaerolineae bacterium]|nr:MAG: phage tail protein I [Anaerolineae bacterium]